MISNFTPEVRHGYRVGMPEAGTYVEVLNSDDTKYGGSGVKNDGALETEPVPFHEREQSMVLTLPPLSTIYLKLKKK